MPVPLDDTVVIVLAGGAGQRLSPLTREDAKPAVSFGGPYRIIDFVLSNCLNSGLRRIFIATQYKSLSLHRHIRMGWSVVSEALGECIDVLPPQQRVGEQWYRGTADAVYQNLYSLLREQPRHLVVLSGDHVYKMDYARMLEAHVEHGAAATVAAIEVPLAEATRFGVLATAEDGRVVRFDEKPARPVPLPDDATRALASMGVYVFDLATLTRVLAADATRPSSHDFGKDILPTLLEDGGVFAYRFRDTQTGDVPYWRDIGTLDSYYDANMDLCRVSPAFNLYDPDWPLRTLQPQAPPAKFVFADDGPRRGHALDSIVSSGCIVSGSRVIRSVLCPNVRVHSYGDIEDAILMPGVRVGRHARIRRAIIDRDVLVPRGALIGHNTEEDRRRHTVTDTGIVVVTAQDDPYIAPIGAEALVHEAAAHRSGAGV